MVLFLGQKCTTVPITVRNAVNNMPILIGDQISRLIASTAVTMSSMFKMTTGKRMLSLRVPVPLHRKQEILLVNSLQASSMILPVPWHIPQT